MKNPALSAAASALGVWLLFVNLLGLTGDVAGMGMVASLLPARSPRKRCSAACWARRPASGIRYQGGG